MSYSKQHLLELCKENGIYCDMDMTIDKIKSQLKKYYLIKCKAMGIQCSLSDSVETLISKAHGFVPALHNDNMVGSLVVKAPHLQKKPKSLKKKSSFKKYAKTIPRASRRGLSIKNIERDIDEVESDSLRMIREALGGPVKRKSNKISKHKDSLEITRNKIRKPRKSTKKRVVKPSKKEEKLSDSLEMIRNALAKRGEVKPKRKSTKKATKKSTNKRVGRPAKK